MTGSLCIVHQNVDGATSIGSLSAWAARTALDAGWRVTLVADAVDPALAPHVEVLPLWTPPRLHVVQWVAARAAVTAAMGGRRFDVVHVHQPQLARLGDVLHLHMIVAVALAAAPPATSTRARLHALQYRAVAQLEDHALRQLPARLVLAPVSEYLQDHYERRYGRHERTEILESPVPRGPELPQTQGPDHVLRLAFLGGADPRKGYDLVLDGLVGVPHVRLLWAGEGSLSAPAPSGVDVVRMGRLDDVSGVLSNCDAVIVASRFDPAPIVVLESLAHGRPVVFTRDVGSGYRAVQAGAGVLWGDGEPLATALVRLRSSLADMSAAARLWSSAEAGRAERKLLAIYDSVARSRAA